MAPSDRHEEDFPPTEGIRIIGASEAGSAPQRGIDFSGIPDFDDAQEEPVSLPPVQSHESFELPHYSEPATGQVPKVVIGEESDAEWSALADQPRWRDTDAQFDEQADFADLVGDAAPKLGALDEDRTEDPFGFSELDDLTEDAGLLGRSESTGPLPVITSRDQDNEQSERTPPTRRRPVKQPSKDRNLPVAIGVGVGLVALGLLAFKAGSLATTVLLAVIVGIASIEYFTAVRDAGYRPATVVGLMANLGLAIAPLFRGASAYPIILGLAALAGLMFFVFAQPGPGAVMNLGVTLLGVAWIGVLPSFGSLILGVARPFEDPTTNQGIGIIIAAVIVTVIYDVGAYFSGKYLGKTPLSAASPNKTQEGLVGGVVLAIVVSLLVIWLGELHPVGPELGSTLLFVVACAIVAPIGDLCESAIKRDLGIKDMGTIIPGHGGVLDRFDGLIFVLPVAYFMAHLLSLGAVGTASLY